MSPWCLCGQLDFQFWKAEVSDLFDKQLKNENFLDGIEADPVQVHTPPLCEVWQIALLKSSTEMQGNHPREATSLPRGSTDLHSLTAEKSFPEAFTEYVPRGNVNPLWDLKARMLY